MDMQYFQSVFAQSKQSETPRVGTIPGRPDLKGIPYFEYGSYFLGDEFRKLCPSAVPIGIGWLASWTWHINTEGLPNVRPVSKRFQTIWKGPAISPLTHAPKLANIYVGTYGIIYVVTPEDLEALNSKLCNRMKVVQQVECAATKVSTPHLEKRFMNVIMHFDPRNTADTFSDIWKNEDEKLKWRRGLGMLQLFSIPDAYLRKVQSKLSGSTLSADHEPLVVPSFTYKQNRIQVSPGVSQLLLQVGENQHSLKLGEQQVTRNRLEALKEHRMKKRNIRRLNNNIRHQISRDPLIHKKVAGLLNSHRNSVRKPSPLSQSPLVLNDAGPHPTQDQRNSPSTIPPQGLNNSTSPLNHRQQYSTSHSQRTAEKTSLVSSVEGDPGFPYDTHNLRLVVLTERDKRSSLQDLIQKVEFPAMKSDPIRVSLFPESNKKSEEEEINYLIDRLRDTLKVPGTTYIKATLPDDTPIAMIGFTVWNSEKDPKSGVLRIVAKKEFKSQWHPSTTNLPVIEELTTKLSEERTKGLKTALKASKNATKIMCLDTFAVAPEYQNKGIGFMLMQFYCQEMLKYKLGSFLLAPENVCDMFTQFHFNAGRKIQVAKGILTCMYRAHTAPIPIPHFRPPQDLDPIETSERNYRPDNGTLENISDLVLPAPESTVHGPNGSMDMPPPPKPSKKPSVHQSGSLNEMRPPPKPTKKLSKAQKDPPNKNVKRKDIHEPNGNDISKGPQTKIRKVAAHAVTSDDDFELVIQENGRAELQKKSLVPPRQAERLQGQLAGPEGNKNIDEWGLVVENGKAIIKKQHLYPHHGGGQPTHPRSPRASLFSSGVGGISNAQVPGPSMHKFKHPKGQLGYSSNFLHNQWLSESSNLPPIRPQKTFSAPLLPNAGIRANGRPDLPEVTVGPRLYAPGVKEQQRQRSAAQSVSACKKTEPATRRTRPVEEGQVSKSVGKPINIAGSTTIDGRRRPSISSQAVELKQVQTQSSKPFNTVVASTGIGQQYRDKTHSIGSQAFAGQPTYTIPGGAAMNVVSTAGGQHRAVPTAPVSSHAGGGKQSFTPACASLDNAAAFVGQQNTVSDSPSNTSIYGQGAFRQQTPRHQHSYIVARPADCQQQDHNMNYDPSFATQVMERKHNNIALYSSFKAQDQLGEYDCLHNTTRALAYSQGVDKGHAGQNFSPQMPISSVNAQGQFIGIQNYNHVLFPPINTQSHLGGQLHPHHVHSGTSQDQLGGRPVQYPVLMHPILPPRFTTQSFQVPSHAPSMASQVTAQHLEDARKHNPNLINMPDDIVRKIISEHLGKLGSTKVFQPRVQSTTTEQFQQFQQFQLPLFPPSIHLNQIHFAIGSYRMGYPDIAQLRDDQIGFIILQNMEKINSEQIKIFRELRPDLGDQTDDCVRFELVHRMSGFTPGQVEEVRQLDPRLSNNDDCQIRLHIVQNMIKITLENVQVVRDQNPHLLGYANGSIRYAIFRHSLLLRAGILQANQDNIHSVPKRYHSPQAPEYSPISNAGTPVKRKATDAGNDGSPSKKRKT